MAEPSTESMVERRRAPRAAVNLPIQLSPHGEARPATLTNLSTSGLACQFGEAMTEMTLVGIDLDIPGFPNGSDVRGAVVRCDKVPDMSPATYEIGIFFTDMTERTRAALHSFVDRQLKT